MPRAKRVPEVPNEVLNQIGNAINGAMASLSNISYAHVMMLDEVTQKHFDSAVVEVNRAITQFNKTYIDRKQPAPRPVPRKAGKKKIHAVLEGDNHEE